MGYIKIIASSLTPTSRTLYRHSNNMGTVIEFDMYGTSMKMFVPDAQYRPTSTAQWGSYGTDISGITNITSSRFYCTDSSYSQTTILDDVPTDEELQSKLSLSSIQTAKTCTNAMSTSTSYAAGLARSVSIGSLGAMDLPNIYEACVLWCEADNIDALDPTAEDYPSAKIGYTHSSGRFRGARFWSSTEYSAYYAWHMDYDGYANRYVNSYRKNYSCYVLPILEL